MRWYFAAMLIVSILDSFDRWFERTAVRVEPWGVIPKRRLVWGVVLSADKREALRFVAFRVPWMREWAQRWNDLDYGWHVCLLIWIEGHGWRRQLDPE